MTSSAGIRLEAVPRRRLVDDIVDQVDRLILNRELSVGDALPPERELATQLNVSRNILREAISKLVQKGLLEVRSGSGTYVARPTVEFLRDSLGFFVQYNDAALLDLIEARRVLEVEIAGLAALRGTEEDRRRVATALDELEASVGNLDRYAEADVRFHAALAVAARNGILRLLLDSIRGALRENIRVLVVQDPSRVDQAMYHHRRIAREVQRQAPEAARIAMREHLESVRQGIKELEPHG